MLVERLAAARCADPFSHLGLCENPDGPGLRLRAWLPDAIEVGVKDLKSGKLVATLTPSDPSGLFETVFTRRKLPFPYQLIARYADASHDIIDPYQCQDAAWHGLAELTAAPEHLYQTLGAQLTTITHLGQSIAGVRFAVYAPSATAVSLIGDFNLWDGRRHPMQRSLCGHWVLFVPGMQAGARYKFELKDLAGNRLPHKSDPVGFYCEQYPSFASVVYDHEQYQWQDGDWQARCGGDKREQALSIYELHVGSWKRHPNGDSLSCGFGNRNNRLRRSQRIKRLRRCIVVTGSTNGRVSNRSTRVNSRQLNSGKFTNKSRRFRHSRNQRRSSNGRSRRHCQTNGC